MQANKTKPRVGFLGTGWTGRHRMAAMVDSGAVEATISAGRLIHLTGQARDRFAAVLPRGRDDMGIAAE